MSKGERSSPLLSECATSHVRAADGGRTCSGAGRVDPVLWAVREVIETPIQTLISQSIDRQPASDATSSHRDVGRD